MVSSDEAWTLQAAVIPAKAGIRFLVDWRGPASAGVTTTRHSRGSGNERYFQSKIRQFVTSRDSTSTRGERAIPEFLWLQSGIPRVAYGRARFLSVSRRNGITVKALDKADSLRAVAIGRRFQVREFRKLEESRSRH